MCHESRVESQKRTNSTTPKEILKNINIENVFVFFYSGLTTQDARLS
jgi:hypothetical protein